MVKLYLVRDHKPVELPTTWDAADGRAVRWSDWAAPMQIFICPPPPPDEAACPGCGEITDCDTSQGTLMPLPGETYEFEEVVQSKRQPGSSWTRMAKVPAWPVMHLVAFRCVGCGHVEIVDTHEGRS